MQNNNDDNLEQIYTIELAGCKNFIDIGVTSNIGARDEQQDSAFSDDDYMYYENGRMISILCDGMGGLSGGQKASSTSVSILADAFYKNKGDISNFYRSIVHNIDSKVYSLKDKQGNRLKAGTTLVSVAIEDNKLFWVSVGDSRIYLMRNKKLKQITQDHNYSMILNKKVRSGDITQEMADSDPQRESLVSYIGMGGLKYIDINTVGFNLINDDYIMLCSDGLYKFMNDTEINIIMSKQYDNMQGLSDALVMKTLEKHNLHQDNISVIVIRFQEMR